MKEKIFVDGKDIQDTIGIRALFYGEGVFETFRFKNRLPVLYDEHLNRMQNGARVLQIPFPGKDHVTKLTEQAFNSASISDAYVKICLLAAGNTTYYRTATSSQLLVIIKKYAPPLPTVRLRMNSSKINSNSPLRAVKSTNYLEYVLSRREAVSAGFDEALLINERDEIVECSAANIFWYKNNSLYTPCDDCGCLPGTTRGLILSNASKYGISVEQGRFLSDSLLESEFIFISNSLVGCVPVSKLDNKEFNTGHSSFKAIQESLFEHMKWA